MMTIQTCPVCDHQQDRSIERCEECGWDFPVILGDGEHAQNLYQKRLSKAKHDFQKQGGSNDRLQQVEDIVDLGSPGKIYSYNEKDIEIRTIESAIGTVLGTGSDLSLTRKQRSELNGPPLSVYFGTSFFLFLFIAPWWQTSIIGWMNKDEYLFVVIVLIIGLLRLLYFIKTSAKTVVLGLSGICVKQRGKLKNYKFNDISDIEIDKTNNNVSVLNFFNGNSLAIPELYQQLITNYLYNMNIFDNSRTETGVEPIRNNFKRVS